MRFAGAPIDGNVATSSIVPSRSEATRWIFDWLKLVMYTFESLGPNASPSIGVPIVREPTSWP